MRRQWVVGLAVEVELVKKALYLDVSVPTSKVGMVDWCLKPGSW